MESWAKGQITEMYGSGLLNINDDGEVKKFNITYCEQIVRFNTKTEGERWRLGLQAGDEIDVLDSYHSR